MSDTLAYYNLIITGGRTINDVPARIRPEVVDLLNENGYHELTVSDEINR